MKRFLIFFCLFPILSLAGLLAYISIGVRAIPDNPEAVWLVPWAYIVCAIPALLCALVDAHLSKTHIPAVVGTALVGYGIAFLMSLVIFDSVLNRATLAFGLIGAVAAAICSWLSGMSMSQRGSAQ